MARDETLTSARLSAEGATEAARRAVNPWGRDGPPIVEQACRELHDIAEAITERCDGTWVLSRADCATAIIAQVKRLRAAVVDKPARLPDPDPLAKR